MRKTITFDKPVEVNSNGNIMTISSVSGDLQYRNGRTRFRPDIRGIEQFLNIDVSEEEKTTIKNAIEGAHLIQKIQGDNDVHEKTDSR